LIHEQTQKQKWAKDQINKRQENKERERAKTARYYEKSAIFVFRVLYVIFFALFFCCLFGLLVGCFE
jgi:uncharacterized membrane protein